MPSDEVEGHALVVGSPGANLRGVDHDVRRMAEMFRDRGFAVDVRTGRRATRAGILAGYDDLIARARPGQPSVVYYAGHGFYAVEASEGRSWQGISPTDLDSSTTTDFRGITAWELSIKQAQLTARTKNVTVILDCCHAAQMSRDGAVRDAVPRALPHPVRLGFAEHLRALRREYGALVDDMSPLGNRDAVRLVACGQSESAFEAPGPDGQYRGVFTDALLEVLREVDGVPVSWAAIDNAIRARVHREYLIQRPDVEGPVRRRLFSLEEDELGEAVTIAARGNGFRLGAGRVMGVVPGDVYGVMPSGSRTYHASDVIAEVEVGEASATFAEATLRSWSNGHTALPPDVVAVPAEKATIRRPVRVEAPDEARAAIEAAVLATPTLRLAEPGASVLATLRLRDGGLAIEDRAGPLFPETRFPEDLPGTIKNLANLGAAQGVRELEGEHGVGADEVEIEWGTIDRELLRRMPDRGGSLGLRDRLYVKIRTTADRPLYAHILNIGLRGKVTLLTFDAPSGIPLTSEEPFVLGRGGGGALIGLELSWPDGLPRDTFPRTDELVVIVTSMTANFRKLETAEYLGPERGESSRLGDLLAQLQHGLPRSVRGTQALDGYLMKRLAYFLHPRDAVMADVPFEVDDNPLRQLAARSSGAWIGSSEACAAPQAADATLAIRIGELVVDRCAALGSSIRVDALVCTRSLGEPAGYAAWTRRLRDVQDGDRLDLGDDAVFHGPVHDFVDLCLWISHDAEASPDLAQLLAACATSPAFRDAADAIRVGPGGSAAPWVAATGASAVLARMAYEQLLRTTGPVVGVYRTSFAADERYGIGRHPANGLQHARDFSFSLHIQQG